METSAARLRSQFLVAAVLILAVLAYLMIFHQRMENLSLLVPQGRADSELVHENGHATEKHSASALAVRECFKKYGSLHIYFNPETNRYLEVCFMDDGKYGVRITERIKQKLEEITAFKKEKLTTWEQMARYIENGGYTNQVK